MQLRLPRIQIPRRRRCTGLTRCGSRRAGTTHRIEAQRERRTGATECASVLLGLTVARPLRGTRAVACSAAPALATSRVRGTGNPLGSRFTRSNAAGGVAASGPHRMIGLQRVRQIAEPATVLFASARITHKGARRQRRPGNPRFPDPCRTCPTHWDETCAPPQCCALRPGCAAWKPA